MVSTSFSKFKEKWVKNFSNNLGKVETEPRGRCMNHSRACPIRLQVNNQRR